MKLYMDLTDDTDISELFDGFFRENPRNQCNPCTESLQTFKPKNILS